MYCMSHLHGCMPGYGDICRTGRQMRNRPGKMHIMRHMCSNLPGGSNCTRCAVRNPPAMRGIFLYQMFVGGIAIEIYLCYLFMWPM